MGSTFTPRGVATRAARFWRRIVTVALGLVAPLYASRRARRPKAGKAHGLPGELIVSLTSYPARFDTLHLTLGCLLDQSVKADRTILWLANGDAEQLPISVRRLEKHGLEIRNWDDLRSFLKLVPALQIFSNAFIATADDDIYYPRRWLERLAMESEEGVITCHRAHRMKRTPDGRLQSYLEWDFAVEDKRARKPSTDIMPTGVAGTLYPPGSLDGRVLDRDLFLELCPSGDDLWFAWCARMARTKFKQVGTKYRLITWSGSQDTSLWADNQTGGNDRMIRALEDQLGLLP
jgi:hypothetical protein